MEGKESKNRFWKGVLVGALVTAFAGLIIVGMSTGIFMIGQTVIDKAESQLSESGGPSEDSGLDMDRVEVKVSQIQEIIDQMFLFDEDKSKVEEGIYTGLMYGLEDPYSVYYTKENYLQLKESTEGIYCGIGVMVSQDRLTGIMTVVKVFADTPGFEAGMQPGDMLYKVDGEDISGMELDLVVSKYIKGKEGTPVTITVLRPEKNDYVDMTMKRRQIEVPTVEHEMLENKVGYILVTQFDTVTSGQFKSAVDDLTAQGMEKLVIDLRSNPGGVLDSVVEMLAYILPEDEMKGMLIYTEDKNGKGERYFSKDGKLLCESDYSKSVNGFPKEDGHQLDLPMAVLVNGDSASASEVFAGAVKDYKWGTLVGTTTFGKGIVQNLIPLGDGTAVKLTVAHYFTPAGIDLHKKGIEPDVVVELDEKLKTKAVVELKDDNQLQEAIKVLETK